MPIDFAKCFDYSSCDYGRGYIIPNELSKEHKIDTLSQNMEENEVSIRALDLSSFCIWNDAQSEIKNKHLEYDPVSLNLPRSRLAIEKIDFNGKVQQLISLLSIPSINKDDVLIHRKSKMGQRMRPLREYKSRFIGVTLNKNSWQALISIDMKKTYIGSYPEEIFAAISYDFYSILVKGLKAATNFDYTRTMIIDMVDNFIQNGNKFVVQDYLQH